MDSEYLITQKRTLESFYTNYKKTCNGCKHPPLLKLEPDRIIPDELHLLLRVTDVLTHSLISAAKTNDKMNNKHLKIEEGPMMKALIHSINSCGVSFSVWETDKDFDCTRLMGDSKKKLLKMLPPKLISCQPVAFASDVKTLWEV